MKNGNRRRHLMRLSPVFLISAFLLAVGVLAVPFYSVKSSSLPTRGYSQPAAKSAMPAKIGKAASLAVSSPAILATWSSLFKPLMPTPPSPEGIATFKSDCVTPQTDFNLGDVVCAKASGVPTTLFPWRVLWYDPAGFVRQSNDASSNDQTVYQYMLPATPTSDVNGQTVDNRGTWRANLASSDGAVRQTALFVVHQPTNPVADVFVQKFVRSSSASVPAGSNISFTLVVGNAGPDGAAAVNLVDSVPSGATLVQFTQNSGPNCSPAGSNNCTIASMVNGDRAEFTAIYNTGTMATGDYQTSATVSSTTPDPNTSNNTSTAIFGITATGSTSCQLTCPSNITTTANTTENGVRGAHVGYDPPVASGTCGSVTSSPVSGSFFPVGTTIVTATSETGGGSCSFTVTVNDTTGLPTITCPSNKTASADSNCQATVDPGTPTTTGSGVTVTGSRSDERNLSDPYPTGTTTITWTATNSAGNASCQQTVTVNDTTPPTITCPASITTGNDPGQCSASVNPGTPTATAHCGNPTVTGTRSDGQALTAPYPKGTTTITWTATSGGGSASCQQTVTVNDTEAPKITCPNTITVTSPTGACSATVILGVPTATDNCDGNVTPVPSRSDNKPITDPFPVGTVTVTWTATDSSGNRASCNQTVAVLDNEPPKITCPANITTSTDPGQCSARVNPGTATATDNCGNPTVTGTRSDGKPLTDPYPKGTTTITWTATDASHNSSSCTQTITVNDTESPRISCPANITRSTDPGACSANINPGTATATDNCDNPTVTGTRSDGKPLTDPYPKGTTTITWTATDSSQNRSSCQQTVTVNDTEPPKVTAPPPSSADPDTNCQAPIPNVLPQTTASDNCGSVTLQQSPAAGTMVGVGSHTITVTATDGSGNTSTSTTTFTVNAVPVFSASVSPTTAHRGSTVILTAAFHNCATTAQTVTLIARFTSPCAQGQFATSGPFTLQPGQQGSTSFPFQIPSDACTGQYTLTVDWFVGGTKRGTTSAQLTVIP